MFQAVIKQREREWAAPGISSRRFLESVHCTFSIWHHLNLVKWVCFAFEGNRALIPCSEKVAIIWGNGSMDSDSLPAMIPEVSTCREKYKITLPVSRKWALRWDHFWCQLPYLIEQAWVLEQKHLLGGWVPAQRELGSGLWKAQVFTKNFKRRNIERKTSLQEE
jgi:hypothetical protein